MGEPLGYLQGGEIIYELEDSETQLGRADHNDIVLKHSRSISSAHARIVIHPRRPKFAKLVDLGSMNGSFVNDRRVQNDSVALNSGDVIRFAYDTETYRFFFPEDIPRSLLGERDGLLDSHTQARGEGGLGTTDLRRTRQTDMEGSGVAQAMGGLVEEGVSPRKARARQLSSHSSPAAGMPSIRPQSASPGRRREGSTLLSHTSGSGLSALGSGGGGRRAMSASAHRPSPSVSAPSRFTHHNEEDVMPSLRSRAREPHGSKLHAHTHSRSLSGSPPPWRDPTLPRHPSRELPVDVRYPHMHQHTAAGQHAASGGGRTEQDVTAPALTRESMQPSGTHPAASPSSSMGDSVDLMGAVIFSPPGESIHGDWRGSSASGVGLGAGVGEELPQLRSERDDDHIPAGIPFTTAAASTSTLSHGSFSMASPAAPAPVQRIMHNDRLPLRPLTSHETESTDFGGSPELYPPPGRSSPVLPSIMEYSDSLNATDEVSQGTYGVSGPVVDTAYHGGGSRTLPLHSDGKLTQKPSIMMSDIPSDTPHNARYATTSSSSRSTRLPSAQSAAAYSSDNRAPATQGSFSGSQPTSRPVAAPHAALGMPPVSTGLPHPLLHATPKASVPSHTTPKASASGDGDEVASKLHKLEVENTSLQRRLDQMMSVLENLTSYMHDGTHVDGGHRAVAAAEVPHKPVSLQQPPHAVPHTNKPIDKLVKALTGVVNRRLSGALRSWHSAAGKAALDQNATVAATDSGIGDGQVQHRRRHSAHSLTTGSTATGQLESNIVPAGLSTLRSDAMASGGGRGHVADHTHQQQWEGDAASDDTERVRCMSPPRPHGERGFRASTASSRAKLAGKRELDSGGTGGDIRPAFATLSRSLSSPAALTRLSELADRASSKRRFSVGSPTAPDADRANSKRRFSVGSPTQAQQRLQQLEVFPSRPHISEASTQMPTPRSPPRDTHPHTTGIGVDTNIGAGSGSLAGTGASAARDLALAALLRTRDEQIRRVLGCADEAVTTLAASAMAAGTQTEVPYEGGEGRVAAPLLLHHFEPPQLHHFEPPQLTRAQLLMRDAEMEKARRMAKSSLLTDGDYGRPGHGHPPHRHLRPLPPTVIRHGPLINDILQRQQAGGLFPPPPVRYVPPVHMIAPASGSGRYGGGGGTVTLPPAGLHSNPLAAATGRRYDSASPQVMPPGRYHPYPLY